MGKGKKAGVVLESPQVGFSLGHALELKQLAPTWEHTRVRAARGAAVCDGSSRRSLRYWKDFLDGSEAVELV